MKKYAFDIAFIIGLASVVVLLNEFDKMDIVKTYAFLMFYACYLLGKLSGKLARKDTSKDI